MKIYAVRYDVNDFDNSFTSYVSFHKSVDGAVNAMNDYFDIVIDDFIIYDEKFDVDDDYEWDYKKYKIDNGYKIIGGDEEQLVYVEELEVLP